MHSLRFMLLCLLAPASIHAATSATPLTFAYKPTPGSVEYGVWTTQTTSESGTIAPQDIPVVNTEEVWRYCQLPAPEGDLEVRIQRLGQRGWVGAKSVPPGGPSARQFVMSPRGEMRNAPEPDFPSRDLVPILPAGAIAPGFEWSAVAPRSRKFPVEIPLKHRFDRILTARGETCAMIVSTADLQGRLPACSVGYSLSYTGIFLFNLAEGVMVSSRTILTSSATTDKPNERGIQETTKRVETLMRRQSLPLSPQPK